jgi:hypothetical protein
MLAQMQVRIPIFNLLTEMLPLRYAFKFILGHFVVVLIILW